MGEKIAGELTSFWGGIFMCLPSLLYVTDSRKDALKISAFWVFSHYLIHARVGKLHANNVFHAIQ